MSLPSRQLHRTFSDADSCEPRDTPFLSPTEAGWSNPTSISAAKICSTRDSARSISPLTPCHLINLCQQNRV